ncbi:MAG: insulinase family protein, partial [Planctomycetes bacterium]|nr:insulinase family protein [Planctomycetota bacterium]
MVLSDQAFRCLLLEDEIEKERGVILAEIRAGKSAAQRIRDKLWPQVFAGSRFAERMVLGLEEVIESATRDDFVDYYQTWFRPERVTLVMVGDTDPGPVVPLIEKWFGDYRPTVSARVEPGAQFKTFTQQRAMVVTDPEYERCQVTIYNILPGRRPTTTVAEARVELVEGIGSWILDRRFDERVKKGEASYHNAGGGVMSFFGEALLVMGRAGGEPGQWEKMLEELIVEISRARQYGFTERELELARAEIAADAERAVNTEATRNARRIAMEMIRAVNDEEPVMSATQELELIERLLPTIELKEVSAAFATSFAPGTFAYALQMPEKDEIKLPTNEEVLAAARAALARKVEPPKDEQRATELLASEPRPGKVVESTTDEELNTTHFWLENGVRVHHRFMDYKKDLVLVGISLGGARLEETAGSAGVTEVAALAFNQPATKRLSSTEITDIMTGKQINLRAEFMERDSLDILVTGSPDDLEIGLQLAHVLLTEGRIEQPAFKKWVETSLQKYERFSKSPQFAAMATLLEVISGNDPRVTMNDPQRINAQSLERCQAWLERLCREAPLEVAVVGEMTQDEVMPLIEKYVGSLPKRSRSAAQLDPLRKLNRGEGPLDRRVSVDTITPQAMVFYGFVGSDARDVRDSQALELAAKTLDSQLIERVREELGLVYSIGVQTEASEVYEDAGMFVSGAPCAPDKAEELVSEIEGLFTGFAENGPTEEELANAKKQVLNNLDTRIREPTFWWGKLRYVDLHKVDLDQLKHLK